MTTSQSVSSTHYRHILTPANYSNYINCQPIQCHGLITHQFKGLGGEKVREGIGLNGDSTK